jgi:LysM domain
VTVPTQASTESAHGPEPAGGPAAPEAGGSRAPLPDRTAIRVICPYLVSASGSWRSATPHRDHRCTAVDPPGHLTAEKQRRLCLSAEHGGCPSFWAARASRAATLAPGADPSLVALADGARRPVARTTPLILEHPRLTAPQARWPFDRTLSQLALVILMIAAFAAVAIARLASPGDTPGTAVASASSTASPTASPTPSPTPTPSASPASSPSATVEPSFRTTYKVKKGDTLSTIATHFKTTVAAIRTLNGLTSSTLKIGQVLKIP